MIAAGWRFKNQYTVCLLEAAVHITSSVAQPQRIGVTSGADMSVNPNHPGACLKDEGIRWDTAALLDTTTFKCTASASEETAETNGNTVVLQADFYRTGDGNEESFTAKMIVSNGDISEKFPGVNMVRRAPSRAEGHRAAGRWRQPQGHSRT